MTNKHHQRTNERTNSNKQTSDANNYKTEYILISYRTCQDNVVVRAYNDKDSMNGKKKRIVFSPFRMQSIMK